MISQTELINPALLGELKRLEIHSKRKLDSDLMGNYASAFRGSGLAFSDLREYLPGDDVKHIHWKASARTGKVYVKSFLEDRQQRILLAVDISQSTAMGSNKTKNQKALEFAALVTLLAIKSSDAVGLALFSNQIEQYLPPKHSRSQVQKILLALVKAKNLHAKTDLNQALLSLAQNHKRRSIIFVISDFYSANFDEALKRLATAHDVICVLLEDPLDYQLPKAGILEIEDAETGERSIIDAASKRTREFFSNRATQRKQNLRSKIEQLGADFICLDQQPLYPLQQLMQRRTHRLR